MVHLGYMEFLLWKPSNKKQNKEPYWRCLAVLWH